MKKLFFTALLAITAISCSDKEVNFRLSGNVEGLKKGSLYLQKIEDTSIVNIDSVEINGDSNYLLETYLEEPQILFLYLDKVDGDKSDDIIDFFAEKGEMTINTSLKNFMLDANIKGSKNHDKLAEYQKMIRRFNDQHLDLIKENFDAQKENNEEEVLATNKKYENLLRRKYLYTVNYSMNNKNMEVAPYIMLTEAFDANIKYLDTVFNSLDKSVRKSKYGEQLEELINERKKLEDSGEGTENE